MEKNILMIGGSAMKNNDKKAVIINLISNTIFQIVMFIISGSGIAYTLKNILISLKDNKISISIFNLAILIFSCIIVSFSIIALGVKIYNHKKEDKEKNNFDDVDDYYFIDYTKHITIYKNGNGIIMHQFTVLVNNTEKFKRIRRKLNIEDGNINSKFSSLEEMMKTNKSERFDKFGFWYYSKDNIISDVKEYYWQKNSSAEDTKVKNNPKELRWIFKINKQRINKETPYNITYAISVPGLSALENGRLNCELLSDEFDDISSSNMNIDHKIKNLRYIISFEEEVELEKTPTCSYIVQGQDDSEELQVEGEEENNILYKKWIFNINNPKFNSDIKVTWKYNKIGNI